MLQLKSLSLNCASSQVIVAILTLKAYCLGKMFKKTFNELWELGTAVLDFYTKLNDRKYMNLLE